MAVICPPAGRPGDPGARRPGMPGERSRPRWRGFQVEAGNRPVQPAGEPPVGITEQLHDRGDQDHADQGGVDEDGDGQAEAEHVEDAHRVADDEGPEDADPEQQALLADAVGLALLVVLDTLAPAERLAFVLAPPPARPGRPRRLTDGYEALVARLACLVITGAPPGIPSREGQESVRSPPVATGGRSWPMRIPVSHCSYRSGGQPRSPTSSR